MQSTAPPDSKLVEDELQYALGLRGQRPLAIERMRDDYRLQLGSYRDLADRIVADLPKREAIHVYFSFTESNIINGMAMTRSVVDHEVRFATVSAGAVLYFHEFFGYLMSRMDVLPRVGIATAETNLPYTFTPARAYPPTKTLVERRLLSRAIPNCPIRRQFAEIMATAASMFLIWHEIGHCANGHVAQSAFNLDEIDRPTDQPVDNILRNHTLEMDADAFATCRALNNILKFPNTETFPWLSEFERFPVSKRLYPTFIAINLIHRLLASPETLATTDEGLMIGTHPHPAIRSHFYRVTAVEAGYAWGFDNTEDKWVARLATKSMLDSVQIWEQITGTVEPFRLLAFDDTLAEEGYPRIKKYMHRLLDCWHLVRPGLEPFSLVPLALSKYDKPKN